MTSTRTRLRSSHDGGVSAESAAQAGADGSRTLRYVLVTVLSAVMCAAWLHVWQTADGVPDVGGDPLYVQATVQAWGDGGPLGRAENLSWPSSYAPWSLPQLGIGVSLSSWLMVGVLSIGSSTAVTWTYVMTAAMNGAGVLLLLRSVPRARSSLAVVVLAAVAGAGTFVLEKYGFGHLNVAAFYPCAVLLAVLLRWSSATPSERRGIALLLLGAHAVGPLWWSFVSLFLIAGVIGIALLRREISETRPLLAFGALVGLGVLPSLMLYASQANPNATATRSAWDSNFYGGRLADVLFASPALNSSVDVIASLAAGASVEPSRTGLLLGGCAAMLVATVIVGRVRADDVFGSRLGDLSIVVLLMFLAGGLGNLQAAGFVLMGGSSPARVWSRLVVLLALLGLVIVVRALLAVQSQGAPAPGSSRRLLMPHALAGLAVVASLGWVLDARALPRPLPQSAQQAAEQQAISFLRGELAPCPVAQLPVDAFPVPRVASQAGDIGNFYYRPFVPYLLAPEFQWSYGAIATATAPPLDVLTAAPTAVELQGVGQRGFCAVLFDKMLAQASASRGLTLPGTDVSGLGSPSFTTDRYDVFVLAGAPAAAAR